MFLMRPKVRTLIPTVLAFSISLCGVIIPSLTLGAGQPEDGQSWRRLGDKNVREQMLQEALEAYRKAEDLGAGDEQLTIDIGDVLKDLNRNKEAYYEFDKLSNSSNADIRQTACEQINYLAPYRNKVLPSPWFADIYAQAGWQTIGDTAFADIKARLGADLLPEEKLQLYALLHYIRDNRSGIVGDFPMEYFDNVARFGVGMQSRLLQDIPLYFLAEAGVAHDLINLGRDKTREDYRAGFTYYDEWFTNRSCEGGVRYPFRFILSASAEAMYYSRYDDAILSSVDLRPGVRLMETDYSSLDASLLMSVNTNNKADDFVQYKQLGGVITWIPDSRNDFKVVLEATNTYFPDDDEFGVSLYFVYSGLF